MPDLKWTANLTPEAGHNYVVFASQLPSVGLTSVPAFMRHTRAITKQLRQAKGLFAYCLRADLLQHRFWTLSVWQDDDSLRAFVRAEPHSNTMGALASRTKDPKFTRWTTQTPLPLPSWEEVESRLSRGAGLPVKSDA